MRKRISEALRAIAFSNASSDEPSPRSRPYEPCDVGEHLRHRGAASLPAGRWNDAERTRLVAPGLDSKRERGALGQAGAYLGSARAFAIAKALCRRETNLVRERFFAIVGNDLDDSWKGGELPSGARGVATCDDDAGGGTIARDLSNDLPRALIGRASHRTRIHDDQVGLRDRSRNAARGHQLLFDGERIRVIHAAPEGDDGVLHDRGKG
jgi:hypothetical protein